MIKKSKVLMFLPVFYIIGFKFLLAESMTMDTITKYIKKSFPNRVESKFKGEDININISGLLDFYKNLPVDEQPEQIADWALYSAMAFLKGDDKTQNDFSKNKLPMRIKDFRNSGFLFYNPGRLAQLNKNEYIAVLPKNNIKQEAILIKLLDENRKNDDFLNGTVHIIDFSYETSSPTISLSYVSSSKISDYYKEEKGYFSKTIRNSVDFEYWISKIDDFTLFKVDSKNEITLGGRRIENDKRENVTIKEVSAIYKAY